MDDKTVELARVYATLAREDVQGRKVIRRLIDAATDAEISKNKVTEFEDRISRLEAKSAFRRD